jgi:hypothetical protein
MTEQLEILRTQPKQLRWFSQTCSLKGIENIIPMYRFSAQTRNLTTSKCTNASTLLDRNIVGNSWTMNMEMQHWSTSSWFLANVCLILSCQRKIRPKDAGPRFSNVISREITFGVYTKENLQQRWTKLPCAARLQKLRNTVWYPEKPSLCASTAQICTRAHRRHHLIPQV